MSAQRQLEYHYTEADYKQVEEFANLKHEYWDGQIVAMAGATPKHNDISGNAYASLHNQLRGRPCRVRMSDQRLKARALQTYPDVIVACPPITYDPGDANTLIDATVIAEVLSRSTRTNDRNAKFDAYKELPSLRHYLLIEQSEMHVEHRYLDGAVWQTDIFTLPADIVRLSAIECELTLGEIYEDVGLSD